MKACSSFSVVTSVTFSAYANFVLTAGKRHLKIWTVGLPTKSQAKTKGVSLTMHGKTVNLGHHKGCTFIAIVSPFKTDRNVADGKGGELIVVYALTDSGGWFTLLFHEFNLFQFLFVYLKFLIFSPLWLAGVLCLLHGGLTITHLVDLKVKKGYELSASHKFIACACNNGVVKLYTIGSLEYAGDLHYSEHKQNNKSMDTNCQSKVSQEGLQLLPTFPDAIACQFSTSEKLDYYSVLINCGGPNVTIGKKIYQAGQDQLWWAKCHYWILLFPSPFCRV